MTVRLGLLAVLVACAVAPVAAGVPGGAAPVGGEQVIRAPHPGSAALVPLSGPALAGATEEASPAQGSSGASWRGAIRRRREKQSAGVWAPTWRAIRPSARKRVLRL
ncbi:hypothetical protein [Rubrivirga sp. IMCC43871]|uniref:hypothetical protein n=1 Tax=Rubrivirga sp. IMCC43871 TaxID=3391575 RepID=UPI00398F8F96